MRNAKSRPVFNGPLAIEMGVPESKAKKSVAESVKFMPASTL
jgi:hypothetical protein